MTKNHCSVGMKKYWSSIPPEKRTTLGKLRAAKRWKDVTPEQRKKHAMKMVKARKAKSKI